MNPSFLHVRHSSNWSLPLLSGLLVPTIHLRQVSFPLALTLGFQNDVQGGTKISIVIFWVSPRHLAAGDKADEYTGNP